ncbi:MAG: CPBP family intramembrane glutamic endopeptidase, partial [Pseudomonadota bacterium]
MLFANGLILGLRLAGFTPAVFGVSGNELVFDVRHGLVGGLFIVLKFAVMLAVGLALMKGLYGAGPRAVGLTRGGHSLLALGARGAVLASFAALPWLVLMTANSVLGFGQGVAGWELVEQAPKNLGFVVAVLATMVIVPPIMEECTMRGYLRARLHIAFGPIGAALISAVIFVFAHGHFYGLDVVLIGSQLAFVFAFAVLAYDTWRSGSVLPAIVAHALINVPFPRSTPGMATALALAAVVTLIGRRAIFAELAQARADWAQTQAKAGVLLWCAIAAALMIATVLYLPLAA